MEGKTVLKLASCQLLVVLYCLFFSNAQAAGLDAPHTSTSGVGCNSCHQMTSTYPKLLPPLQHTPVDIDDTLANNVCTGCHNDADAPSMSTHSSRSTSTKHGNWTVECWVCHNQHSQEQKVYGNTFGYIRRSIKLANIKGGDGNTLGKTGTKTVIFKGETGPNSFADGDATVDGICEVCHTQTSHWRNDGSLAGVGLHAGLKGSKCTGCHPHTSGFKADCNGCHPYPPATGAHKVHVTTLGYDCSECHYNNTHNPANLATSPAYFLNDYDRNKVEVAFDPAGFNSDANNGSVLGAPAFTRNATSGQATCANLACHNPDTGFTGKGTSSSTNNIPAWGSTISACTDCHTTSGAADGARGSHSRHSNSTYSLNNVACTGCHADINVIDPGTSGTDSRHADKVLNIDQVDTYPVHVNASLPEQTGITATYTDGAPGTTTGSKCSNVYCHGGFPPTTVWTYTNTGNNYTFTWGSTNVDGSGNCYYCHKFGSSAFSNTTNQSHYAHIDQSGAKYKNGPQMSEYGCGDCHATAGGIDSLHINGQVDLKGSTDGTLANTTACDKCHGTTAGIAEAKAYWPLNVKLDRHRITDCLYCHNSTAPANSRPGGNGINAPAVNSFLTTGHGKTNGTFEVTGNSGPAYTCETCHHSDSTHFDHKSGVELRLKILPTDGLDFTSPSSELCLDCHRVGKTTPGTLGYDATQEASVHSGGVLDNYNTNASSAFPAYGDKGNYAASPGYQCADCHNVHGTVNLAMLKSSINGKVGGINNTVPINGLNEATATDLSGLDPTTAANDGLCDACHTASGSSHPDTSHANNHYQGNTGQSCMACHSHTSSFAASGPRAKITDLTGDASDQIVDFGSIVATATANQTITVKNPGTANLIIGSIAGSDALDAPFSLVVGNDNCSGKTLAPAVSCTFAVSFAPSATWSFSDTFDVPSNDAGSPATITVNGTATAAGPDITVTDTITPAADLALPYGKQVLTVGASRTITLTNDGVSPLIFGAVPSTNLLAAPFALTANTCSNQTLDGGASCTLTVTYTPTATGPHTDSFDISSNDPDEGGITFQVSGTGVKPVYAYITTTPSNGTVSRIRTNDQVKIAGITSAYSGNLAVLPDGSKLYASYSYYDSSSYVPHPGYMRVYNASLGLIKSISLGNDYYPRSTRMATAPSGSYVYVLRRESPTFGTYTNKISAIDTTSDAFVLNVQLPGYETIDTITALGVSPDGQYVYYTHDFIWTSGAVSEHTLTIRRTLDLSLVGSVPLEVTVPDATGPREMAILPDNSKVYVLGLYGNLSVIKPSDLTVLPPITVGKGQKDLVLSPDGSRLYVVSSDGSKTVDTITFIDTATDTILQTVDLTRTLGCTVRSMAITPDGKQLYITATAGTSAVTDYVAIVETDYSAQPVQVAVGNAPIIYGNFIQTDDPNATWPDIQLTDTAGPASDHGVPFGSLTVNQTSTKTVTVTNKGTANLIIGNIATANPLAAPFSILSNTCSSQTLAPAATCTLTVAYTPTTTETLYDSFDIPSNDPNEKIATVTLSGTGVVPDITVTDEILPADDLKIPFGNGVITATLSKIITVTNQGPGNLVFSGITTSAPFAIKVGGYSPACASYMTAPGLASGGMCQIYVQFTPPATIDYNSTVNIQSNDPDESLVSVAVTGTGTPLGPDITLTGTYSFTVPAITNLDFGYFDIYSTQTWKYLYARNDGTQNLTTGNISLPAGPFSFNINNLSNQTIAFPPSTNISSYSELYFNPTSVGTFTAQLSIPTNDPDENPALLNLTGIGYEPMIAFVTYGYQIRPFYIYYNANGVVYNSQYTDISPGNYTSPLGVAATPSITYITLSGFNQLQFYQTSTRGVLATVNVGQKPKGVAVTPNGEYIYVANFDDNTVSVVSRATQAVVATVTSGSGPTGVDVTPDNSHVYVTNFTDNTVSVISTSDNSVIKTIPVGANPNGIAVSPNGAYVYVTNYGDKTVSVIQTSDNTVAATINVGTNPFGIAFTPDGSRVYVSNYTDSSVSVIQTSDNTVIKTITGILTPKGVAATPDGRFIYVVTYDTSPATCLVHVIQTSDNTEVTTAVSYINATAFGKFITPIRNGVDLDGVPDAEDNCPAVSNPFQTNSDGDGFGDVCDPCPADVDNDSDNDGICNSASFLAPKTGSNDNCPTVANANQADADLDGIGDDCDSCPNDPNNDADGDGICADLDNCPVISNAGQLDSDCDGNGDDCSTPPYTYTPPAALNVSAQQFLANSTVSWNDNFSGENGYRIERKDGACGVDNTNPFVGLATIYQLDDFATGIDQEGWWPGAQVATTSTQGVVPASVSDATGSSSVTWENGAVTLHSVTNGTGTAGYNYSTLSPKNFAGIIGDRDFDLQYDFSLPNGTITATQYFSYVRLDMYLPSTDGKKNNMFVARMKDGFVFSATVNGVNEVGVFTTTATSGTLRLVRGNRQLSGYYWDGTNWQLLHQHSQQLTADLTPTWAGFAQHANRAEAQDIIAVVDNFRFNPIGGLRQYNDSGLTAGTDYCYRIYPLKTDSCPNWQNHAAQFSYTTPSNALPAQPINLTPVDGATDVYALLPTITASPFSDPDAGDSHYASQWRISTGSGVNFDANVVYNSGTVVSTAENHTVTTALATNTTYYWLVRYQDNKGEWSPYSSETSFVIANAAPSQPANALPAEGATDVTILPTLTASAFADSNGGDTFQASQWRISTGSSAAFDAGLVYDSGTVAGINSHAVTGGLAFSTSFSWKVRYQDSRGGWSSYSNETSFTTIINAAPNQPTNISPANGAINVAGSPTLTASAFVDGDAGDTHQASQWQVSSGSSAAFASGIIYDSGTVAGTTSHTVTITLTTKYSWRVRYQDSKGVWSPYSNDTSFTITGMISLWHLDEGSGTLANDAAGTNNGTVRNGAVWDSSGAFAGNALIFDGVNDDVVWTYSAGIPANNFTLEAMVKATTTHEIDTESTVSTTGTMGQRYLFGANHSGTDGGAGVSVGTNGISVYEHGSGYMPPLAVYNGSLGTGWNHIVITYTSKQPRIYLNGALVRTGLTSTKTNVFAPTALGGGTYGFFPGTVDEVVVYGTALNDAEILQRCRDLGKCAP